MNNPLLLLNQPAPRRSTPHGSPVGKPFARIVSTLRVGRGPWSIALNPSTNRLYVANSGSNSVSVIDAGSNMVIATVRVGKAPGDIVVNRRTNLIYVSNLNDSTVSIINGFTNRVVKTLSFSFSVNLVLNPVMNRIYALNPRNNRITVLNVVTNRVITQIAVPLGIGPAAFNPLTNRLYVAGNQVTVISGASNRIIATVTVGTKRQLGDIAVNPATNRIYVLNSNGRTNALTAIDGRTNQVIANVRIGVPSNLSVNSGTNRIYTGVLPLRGTAALAVINGANNRLVTNVTTGQEGADDILSNAANNMIFVASEPDGTVTFIDGRSNRVFATLFIGQSDLQPISFAFSNRSNRLYAANFNTNTVTVIQTGRR